MMKKLSALIAVGLLAASGAADAALVEYNRFTNFGVDEVTPMSNKAPDSPLGSAFRATFSSSPNAGGFMLEAGVQSYNSLFFGNGLVDQGDPDSLTISFNQAVLQLSVNFAVPLSGRLNLLANTGDSSFMDSSVPGTWEGGTLTFVGGTPFTSITLSAITDSADGGLAQRFAIDGLRLTTPEPGTLALLGLSLAGLAASRRRK